jgi:hypothetical protein
MIGTVANSNNTEQLVNEAHYRASQANDVDFIAQQNYYFETSTKSE